MKEYKQTLYYNYIEAMNWELYKKTLNWELGDLAEQDIKAMFPEETAGLNAVATDIVLTGDITKPDTLQYDVTITFESEE